MKIAWSGVHDRRKALPILLYALAKIRAQNPEIYTRISVNVLGKGSQTNRWKQLSKALQVDSTVIWHGWLQKNEAEAVVSNADIFVLTSIHDLTSTVLLEALSKGNPVICLDHCGFSDVLDGSCGIKIPVGSAKSVINGFADAIVRLSDDNLRRQMSEGALRRAQEYQWTRKRSELKRLYGTAGKKVLVSVYACSPYRGSEPGMGWNYLKAIAEEHEVWAIVEKEKWEKDIEKYLSEHPDEMKTVHWEFVHKLRARLLRKLWPPSYYWFYRIWQWRVYRRAVELHRQVGFDLVHQLNMVGFREPGYLWKLPIPFVWGPVGGLGYTDWRLLPLTGMAGSFEFVIRNVINWCHSHLLRRPRLAARKAAESGHLIAATGENQQMMKKLWNVDATVLCEIGVDG